MVKKDRLTIEAIRRVPFIFVRSLLANSAHRLELTLGVFACDAFEENALAWQKFDDTEGAFSAITARHDLGAKRDGHAGARPTVALRVALIIVEFFSHPLFARAAAAQEHCRAQRA